MLQSLAAEGLITTERGTGDARVRRGIRGYFDELAARFQGGFDPAMTLPASEDELTPPAGLLLLATLPDEPVGAAG